MNNINVLLLYVILTLMSVVAYYLYKWQKYKRCKHEYSYFRICGDCGKREKESTKILEEQNAVNTNMEPMGKD